MNKPKPKLPQISIQHKDKETISTLEEAEEAEGHRRSESGFWNDFKDEVVKRLPATDWITKHADWPSMKPVIRSSISAWICLLFMIIPRTERLLGQASFLVIIGSIISPPSDTFAATVERQLNICFFITVGWAWSCLGIKLASLARSKIIPDAPLPFIFTGVYLETGPTAICAVFLFIGSAVILYLKARLGPGPFTFATVFSCLCIDICMTAAPLFPYPYYSIGQIVVLPLTIQSAVAILSAALIFPETVNAQFIKRLRGAILPLVEGIRMQPALLEASAAEFNYNPEEFNSKIEAAEAGLFPLTVTARLAKRDFSWGRFGCEDLLVLQHKTRILVIRSKGMAFFFKILDTNRERLMNDNLKTTPATTRMHTPESTRPSTPVGGEASTPVHRTDSIVSRRKRHHFPHFHFRNSFFAHQSQENIVGVFESQKYLDLEARLTHPESERLTQNALHLLTESSKLLAEACANGVQFLVDWYAYVNESRFASFASGKKRRTWEESVIASEEASQALSKVLQAFRTEDRMRILEPYLTEGDPQYTPPPEGAPPHRFLFNSFVYQYHLWQFAKQLLEALQHVNKMEKECRRSKLWMPVLPFGAIIRWTPGDPTEDGGLANRGDEDPDIIPGLVDNELGETEVRDPDALPPGNLLEVVGTRLHSFVAGLGGGNVIFALKAGVLTILLSLISFLKSSAEFAYLNKAVWALFMGQLALARFRGDTGFAWIARAFSTLYGSIVGMVIWYIASGSGQGNSYGLAATLAVAFPMILFIRLYYSGSPMAVIIFCVTIALVIGYSWQDTHLVAPGNPGIGWDVAWRRFLLVIVGITAAFLFSFLPPSYTLRSHQRRTYARTAMEIGALCCSLVSYANSHAHEDTQDIVKNILALRHKLTRSLLIQANISYEFTIRGKWPRERYRILHEIQIEIAYLLSHLLSVLENLESTWSMAFLQRARFLDPEFQGDLLAIISLVSYALRTATPLPQITPGPLLDRFLQYQHGFNVVRHEIDDDYGLPRVVTLSTLADEQYLCFCVGVASAYGIVNRIDRLMVATKQLVGEHFHIHGIGVSASHLKGQSGRVPNSLTTAPATPQESRPDRKAE